MRLGRSWRYSSWETHCWSHFGQKALALTAAFSALDAVWMITHFHRTGHTADTLLALSKRSELLEKLRQLSAFTKDTFLKPDFQAYELSPSSRWKLFQEGAEGATTGGATTTTLS